MFLWGDEVAHQFWNKYREDLVVHLPAKIFAKEVINKLKQENNEIYIITARYNNDKWFSEKLKQDVEGVTKRWLKDNGIYYDMLLFGVKNKGEICEKNQIDIMIEDDPKNLRDLNGKTKVMVFDYPYNRNKEFDKLTRVYSWYDIYNKIKEVKNDISNS